MMQVQARMDDEHTKDVTSEMQLRCLKEMGAAFWRGQTCPLHVTIIERMLELARVVTLTSACGNCAGWAEIAWRLENDNDPSDLDSFFDHCEECMPDVIKLVNRQ